MRKPTDSRPAMRQAALDRSVLHKVNQEIYRRFPEVAGQAPKVQEHAPAAYRLVYQGEVTTANHKRMLRWVRVVITDQGEILKITTSH
ncbi:MAG: hypothetical protein AB1894_12445 [Chloroflexota bacterium]